MKQLTEEEWQAAYDKIAMKEAEAYYAKAEEKRWREHCRKFGQ